MSNVLEQDVATTLQTMESPLPAEIQEALGELVGAAREGLLALSVGVGLRVVHELMESEVSEVVGPKGRLDSAADRARRGVSGALSLVIRYSEAESPLEGRGLRGQPAGGGVDGPGPVRCRPVNQVRSGRKQP